MPKKLIKTGLIGFPVAKSLSRDVFAVFSQILGTDISYRPMECGPEDLEPAIISLKTDGWAGFNVTLPYKTKVAAMLDLADPAVKACGSVNAVRFGRAGLEGMNTDARALLRAMEEACFDAAGKAAAVFGSGGSAASSGWALGRAQAASVTFHARNAEAAGKLAVRLAEAFPRTEYRTASFSEPAKGTSIFVNATPLGMYAPGRPPCAPGRGTLCADLAYTPEGTDFSKESQKAGASAADGLSLLVWQAALSLQFWSGLPAGDIVKFKREALAAVAAGLKGDK